MSNKNISNIAIFCGADTGKKPEYIAAAKQLATSFCTANLTMIYGGAKVGLMQVLADQMLELGGEVIGVIPELLMQREIAHPGLKKLHVVSSMHERKLLITELADAFILLPGGIGSLDEFFEVYTLAKIGVHHKLIGILNTANYYDSLLKFIDHAMDEGFLKSKYKDMIVVENEPELLLSHFIGTTQKQQLA